MSSDKVRVAHLLIKHSGSRNPVSRRTGAPVSLTPEDAYRELQAYEARLRPNDAGSASAAAASEILRNDFPRYALERSDCSSFRQNGDLGEFGRGQMQRPFEEASFALQPGEMSTIVDTDSGYHLIYRIS